MNIIDREIPKSGRMGQTFGLIFGSPMPRAPYRARESSGVKTAVNPVSNVIPNVVSMRMQETTSRLPIYEIESAFVAALSGKNRRLVLQAPTGSGKSTQVPQMLLNHGLLGDGQVVILQPRRLAARLLASRVAQERGVELGQRGRLSGSIRECDERRDADQIRNRRNSAAADDPGSGAAWHSSPDLR